MNHNPSVKHTQVNIQGRDVTLAGNLAIPQGARAIVIFAHGSGSSRHSPRNRFVADMLNEANLATLLFDLLTPSEEVVDQRTSQFRFDIELLAKRLTDTVDWVGHQSQIRELSVGLFGASTGAAAALVTAAERPDAVNAIVSRGGRPDLAGDALRRVKAPTLLIVGGLDTPVIELNRQASMSMGAQNVIEIVPGATHLFEEPGKLDEVASLARDWFGQYTGSE